MTKIISADEIKKSFKGYDPKKVENYHKKSAKLADKEFDGVLKDDRFWRIILMNGGTASGKTEFLSEYLFDYKGVVFDGTLSTVLGAKIKIRKILKKNKTPIVYSVIPDDLKRAFIAFLHRDRKFSDIHFYKTHSGSREVLLWIAKNYPKVKLMVYKSIYDKKDKMIFKKLYFDSRKEKIKYLETIQIKENNLVKFINYKNERNNFKT
ncbi:MAG: hypothetical protein GF347_04185 [Candidatus Moranbacteria bacterium]|nr:hypothetical protein [Candidatus Moranbacteria bacterium]